MTKREEMGILPLRERIARPFRRRPALRHFLSRNRKHAIFHHTFCREQGGFALCALAYANKRPRCRKSGIGAFWYQAYSLSAYLLTEAGMGWVSFSVLSRASRIRCRGHLGAHWPQEMHLE